MHLFFCDLKPGDPKKRCEGKKNHPYRLNFKEVDYPRESCVKRPGIVIWVKKIDRYPLMVEKPEMFTG